MFCKTTALKKLAKLQKKIRAAQGGTSASKTISILQLLAGLAQTDYFCKECEQRGCQDPTHKISWKTDPKLTSITSESTPHLKRGARRDFTNIMKAHGYWNSRRWNSTDSIYTFETDSQIEFFSADQSEKLRGGRRDRGFMNEANNMTLDQFDEFEVRTKDFVFLDWNPTVEFWYYTEVEPKRTDVEKVILTYKDNEGLSQEIIDSIEQRKNRKGWWQVYGLGQLGEVEGRIYKGWEIIDEIPRTARLERMGLDFGYSNDPSSLVAIYYYDGGYILDEIFFLKGMSNKRIADQILDQEEMAMVVADSAEPKSIDEIRGYGVNITGAEKGKDSVEHGIQLVQDQKIMVTKRSVNVIKEYRNYLWKTDKDGNIQVNPSVPEHDFSHSMDAIRYGMVSLLNKPTFKNMEASEPLPDYYEAWN